jgi:hypothetical protein
MRPRLRASKSAQKGTPVNSTDLSVYLAVATVVARVTYAVVARLVAPHPRWRAVVEAIAAASPDVLRVAAQLFRALSGRDFPLPLIDARDAELRDLRRRVAALAGARLDVGRVLADSAVESPDDADDAARGRVIAAVNAQARNTGESGRAELRALVVVALLSIACSGGLTAVHGAALETAGAVLSVTRKVRAAICAEQLDDYLGPVRERVIVVREAPDASPAAVDDATVHVTVDAGAEQ